MPVIFNNFCNGAVRIQGALSCKIAEREKVGSTGWCDRAVKTHGITSAAHRRYDNLLQTREHDVTRGTVKTHGITSAAHRRYERLLKTKSHDGKQDSRQRDFSTLSTTLVPP